MINLHVTLPMLHKKHFKNYIYVSNKWHTCLWVDLTDSSDSTDSFEWAC